MSTNQNYKPLVCDVATGDLKCRSAANYMDPAKSSVTRSQVYVFTEGNNGVDRYVFAPTSVAGAGAIKVRPASACGPDYA